MCLYSYHTFLSFIQLCFTIFSRWDCGHINFKSRMMGKEMIVRMSKINHFTEIMFLFIPFHFVLFSLVIYARTVNCPLLIVIISSFVVPISLKNALFLVFLKFLIPLTSNRFFFHLREDSGVFPVVELIKYCTNQFLVPFIFICKISYFFFFTLLSFALYFPPIR